LSRKAGLKRCLGLKQAGNLKWNRRQALAPGCVSVFVLSGADVLGV
jgi:hypothetical protein